MESDKSHAIRIATSDGETIHSRAKFAGNQLGSNGFRAELVNISKNSPEQNFNQAAEKALLSKEVDLAVMPMNELSTTAAQGLRIGAISERSNPAMVLLIRREAFLPGNELFLKSGAKVGLQAEHLTQFLQLKPDADCSTVEGDVELAVQLLLKAEFDALLVPAGEFNHHDDMSDEIETIQLNPREFVPAAARGVLAYQLRADDSDTLQAVRSVHDTATHETVSVERKVQKLLTESGRKCHGVYCEKDRQNNFHVWAATEDVTTGEFRKIQVSSSTNFELAEELYRRLCS